MPEEASKNPLDADTWALLPDYLGRLPNRVRLQVWGDPQATPGEREAARLANVLAHGFEQIEISLLPRRVNYPYYPVLGVLGAEGEELIDYGVRLIGLPAGLQMTSLIAAIQSVAFRGTTLEPKTRIQLSQLQKDVQLELLSAADDELGTVMAKTVFSLAVASTFIRSYLIMADVFPEALWKYSVSKLPHLIINSRVHVDGGLSEETLLRQIASALRTNR